MFLISPFWFRYECTHSSRKHRNARAMAFGNFSGGNIFSSIRTSRIRSPLRLQTKSEGTKPRFLEGFGFFVGLPPSLAFAGFPLVRNESESKLPFFDKSGFSVGPKSSRYSLICAGEFKVRESASPDARSLTSRANPFWNS